MTKDSFRGMEELIPTELTDAGPEVSHYHRLQAQKP